MAIKLFNSDQDIRTASSQAITTAFSNKPTISWSLFLKAVMDTSGSTAILMGGQSSNFFSIARNILASPNVRFLIQTSGGNVSFNNFYVPTGSWTHLGVTQTPGAQYCYVNGSLYDSGSNPNRIVYQPSARYIGFGHSNPASGNLIYDDVAIYSGIVLSQSQIRQLSTRDLLPDDPSLVSNLMFYYRFDNPSGGVIAAGQTGLNNLGFLGSNGNLTTVLGSPEWVGETGVYVFSLLVRSIETGKSGKSIIMTFTDLNGNPINVSNATPSVRPTISINGGSDITLASGILAGDGGTVDIVDGAGYYIFYPVTGVTIQPTDTITLSTADIAYWTSTDGSQSTNQLTNRSVDNYVGVEAYNYLMYSTSGLKVGLNSNTCSYYEEPLLLADLTKGGWAALDTKTRPRQISSIDDDSLTYQTTHGDYWGLRPHMPSGNTLVTYYGTGTLAGLTITSTGNPNFGFRNDDPSSDPDGQNLFFNTTAIPISGVEIYATGTYGQLFNPRIIQILRDTKCAVYRTMNANGINSSNITDYSDFANSHDQTWRYGFRKAQAKTLHATSFQNVSGLLSQNYIFMHIFTSGNHNFVDGQIISFTGDFTLRVSGSATTSVTTTTSYEFAGYVTSPSSILFQRYKDTGGQISGVQPLDNMLVCDVTNIYRPSLFARLVNEVSGCDLLYCMPHAMNDSGIVNTIHELTQTLNPGKKLYLELSNEHWNPGSAFLQYDYFHNMGHLNPMIVNPSSFGVPINTSYIPLDASGNTTAGQTRVNLAYSERAGQMHNLASGVMAQYGRANDLVRVFGGRASSDSESARILEWARARGYRIDALATAPYYNTRADDLYANNYIALDSEQVQDLLYAALKYPGGRYDDVLACANVARSFGARSICYEGGVGALAVGSNTIVSGVFTLTDVVSIKAGRHPRLADSYFYMLKGMVEAGYDLFCHYNIGHGISTEPDNHWGMFNYYNEPIGRGDGSDGLFDNRTNLQNLGAHVSHLGYAMSGWNDGDNYLHRKIILIPSGSKDLVNPRLNIMGFGPNNFTIGVLPTGEPNSNPATYYVADMSLTNLQYGGLLRPFLIQFASGYIEGNTSGVATPNRLSQFLGGLGLKLK